MSAGLANSLGCSWKCVQHDPAMRAVDRRLEQRDDQRDEHRGDDGVDDAPVAQPRRVDVHQRDHDRAAGDEPHELARDEVVRVVRPDLLHGDDGRGRIDHHHADDDDEHRRAEEVGVVGEFAAHGFGARVSGVGCRVSGDNDANQLLKVLAAMFEVSVLIEAGAGGRQQDDFARLRVLARVGDGVLHVAGVDDRRGTVERFGDAFRGGADGEHARALFRGRDRASVRTRRLCLCRRG